MSQLKSIQLVPVILDAWFCKQFRVIWNEVLEEAIAQGYKVAWVYSVTMLKFPK